MHGIVTERHDLVNKNGGCKTSTERLVTFTNQKGFGNRSSHIVNVGSAVVVPSGSTYETSIRELLQELRRGSRGSNNDAILGGGGLEV